MLFGDVDRNAAQMCDDGVGSSIRLICRAGYGKARSDHLPDLRLRITSEGHGRMDRCGEPSSDAERCQYSGAAASADMEDEGRCSPADGSEIEDALFEGVIRNGEGDQIAGLGDVRHSWRGDGPANQGDRSGTTCRIAAPDCKRLYREPGKSESKGGRDPAGADDPDPSIGCEAGHDVHSQAIANGGGVRLAR